MTEEQAEIIARNLAAIERMMAAMMAELHHVQVMQKYLSRSKESVTCNHATHHAYRPSACPDCRPELAP